MVDREAVIPAIIFFGGPFHGEGISLEKLQTILEGKVQLDADDPPPDLKVYDTDEDVPVGFLALGMTPPVNKTVATSVYHYTAQWNAHWLYVICYDCSKIHGEEAGGG